MLGLRLGRGEEDGDGNGMVGYVVKYGYLVRTSKNRNAGGPGRRGKDGVEG